MEPQFTLPQDMDDNIYQFGQIDDHFGHERDEKPDNRKRPTLGMTMVLLAMPTAPLKMPTVPQPMFLVAKCQVQVNMMARTGMQLNAKEQEAKERHDLYLAEMQVLAQESCVPTTIDN